MFHDIFPPLMVGLGIVLVYLDAQWVRTKDRQFEEAARFWTLIFALNFGIGVATGIVMEFEFGTNWATYSRFVGDVFGSVLAAVGILAFFIVLLGLVRRFARGGAPPVFREEHRARCQRPHGVHRVALGGDPGDHDPDRRHRYAPRPDLHGPRRLDVPRQGALDPSSY